jgi:hypothetical protein
MANIQLTKTDIEKGIRNEERNEAMNYMNSAHKATNEAYRDGYDSIVWGKPTMQDYYAYLHVNGTTHVKRYRPELQRGDIDEAVESDFVVKVVGPFMAIDRKQATQKAKELLNAVT